MGSHPALDVAAALDRFDGDHELFLTLAGMFVERAPQALASIQAAMAAQNLPLLAKEAHKLKGSVLEFCAQSAAVAAAQLEASAGQTAVENMAALCEQVQSETQRLTIELKGIMEKGFPS